MRIVKKIKNEMYKVKLFEQFINEALSSKEETKLKKDLEKAVKEWKVLNTTLTTEFKKYQDLIKDVSEKESKVKSDILSMMDTLGKTKHEVGDLIVSFTRGYTRSTIPYKEIIEIIEKKVNGILRAFIARIIKEKTRTTEIKATIDIKKKKELNEGLKQIWDKFISFVSKGIESLKGYMSKYSDAIEDLKDLAKSLPKNAKRTVNENEDYDRFGVAQSLTTLLQGDGVDFEPLDENDPLWTKLGLTDFPVNPPEDIEDFVENLSDDQFNIIKDILNEEGYL